MRFGKMPSSCLCFCKASALKARKPWLAFLVGFWLAWLGFWLAFWLLWFGSWLAFWLVWFGFWLAFWLVWFGSWLAFWLVWFGSWLAFWLVWFGSCWLSGWFGLAPGWLSGWFGLAPGWLSGWFGLALFFFPVFLARLAETQLLGILQAYLGVSILQPHACTQRFRLRILRRTRSNAGRVEYKPFGKPPLKREPHRVLPGLRRALLHVQGREAGVGEAGGARALPGRGEADPAAHPRVEAL